MEIKHPDLFAASLLVAGQWDAAKVSRATWSGKSNAAEFS
jgi:predicted peptidase